PGSRPWACFSSVHSRYAARGAIPNAISVLVGLAESLQSASGRSIRISVERYRFAVGILDACSYDRSVETTRLRASQWMDFCQRLGVSGPRTHPVHIGRNPDRDGSG